MTRKIYDCKTFYKNAFDLQLTGATDKPDASATNGNVHIENGIPDKLIQQRDTTKRYLRYRYLVALLEFFLFFEINTYRLNTSISIVTMVNQTAVNSLRQSNMSSESCHINISESVGFSAVEAPKAGNDLLAQIMTDLKS
ncbi:hypothetical protein NPIL_618641 [Nephila pilipes]|uniref:Uncharacterized protein n=1 Tax=Nephila pilipes TaxID=299642 RepID=A0A8X6QWT1_NEPPI|nr:hypothetical protein NPIL_618641 [Nephila pilipes]